MFIFVIPIGVGKRGSGTALHLVRRGGIVEVSDEPFEVFERLGRQNFGLADEQDIFDKVRQEMPGEWLEVSVESIGYRMLSVT